MADPARTSRLKRLLHESFLATVIAKLLLGLAQIAAAFGLQATTPEALRRMIDLVTASELRDDPTDTIAHWLQKAAAGFSIEAQTFYTLYFAGHGVLNAGIALALLSGRRWTYPVSIAVLIVFIFYQLIRFAQTGDMVLIALTLIDVVVLALAWREYRALPPIS